MGYIQMFFLIIILTSVILSALIFVIVKVTSPKIETSFAKVIEKRNESQLSISMNHGSTLTSYFVSFELESGERKVFSVGKDIYGTILVNDEGSLRFKGNKFKSFSRM